ncbi:MAG: hypothetical protein DMG81_06520 [Acidobacteria bacterium]|nr:MAG: hypothetical protein DMG81_06520 [Acidobacteriota bacterium]
MLRSGKETRLLKLRASCGFGHSRLNLVFILFIIFLASFSFSQDELPKGTLEGTVIDSSGAPVAGATVAINSRSAEVPLSLTTDKDGKYATGALNAGTYTVQIEARNFKSNRFVLEVRNGQKVNGQGQSGGD